MIVTRRQIRILHMAVVDNLSPVRILTLQLVAEVNLIWCNEGQRRVINRKIAHMRRQPQSVGGIIGFAIGFDLLDERRRGTCFEGRIAKAVEAFRCSCPDIAFVIFEQRDDIDASKAVRIRIRPSLVDVHDASSPDSSYLPAVETLQERSDVGAFVVLPQLRNGELSSAIGVQKSQPLGLLPELIHETTNRLRLGIQIQGLSVLPPKDDI
jgi:hypothetical protein